MQVQFVDVVTELLCYFSYSTDARSEAMDM